MATISVGEVEASIRLRDAVSPTVQAVSKALHGGVGVTLQWTQSQQRAAMAMAGAHAEALKLNQAYSSTTASTATMANSMVSSTSKAAGLADSFGRTSTTLARSAEVFGLNAGALRALDDAADVAELGFKGLSESAVGLNAATMGVVGAGFAVGTAIGGWLNGFASIRSAADDATRGLYDFLQANKLWGETSRTAGAGAMQGLKEFSAQMGESHKKAIAAQVESLKAGGATAAEIDKVLKAHQKIPPEVEKQVKGLKESEKAAAAYAEKVKAAAEAHKQLIDQMTKQTSDEGRAAAVAEGLSNLEEVIGRIGGSAKLSATEVKALADAAAKLGPAGREWASDLADSTGTILGIRSGFNEALPAVKAVAKEVKNIHVDGQSAKEAIFDFGKAFEGVADTIISTFIEGGDIGAAIENSFAQLGKNAGEAFGTAIGGPLGGAIGGALGGLLGKGVGKLFGGLFGDKEIMKVNDLRDAFFDAQGGFVELQKKLVGLTNQDLVKKVFDARTVEDFNAAVAEVNGLLGSQMEAEEKLQEAIDRYGFTIEELGPKFQAQKLNEQALALLQDFKLLTASGIDVSTVIEKMGPDLNSLVDNARKTGQALPEALRPVIDALIEQGALIDENGQAYESAADAGVTFAKSLEEGLQGAIDAIDRLVAALTGIPVNIPAVPGAPAPSGAQAPHEGTYPGFADGGYVAARPGGQVIRVAEGGQGEFIVPEDRMGQMAGSLSLTIAGITVQGASSPAETAKLVVQAIRDNIAGLRTELAAASAGT